jgi:chemotaxis protein MotB
MKEQEKEQDMGKSGMRVFPGRMLRNRPAAQNDLDSNWLITLSDVLSLLLVFFVVFTFMARSTKATASKEPVNKTAETAATPGIKAETTLSQKNMVDEMSVTIKKLEMENDVSVHAVDKEIIITLKEKVTFLPGEAEALNSSEPILDDIARIIRQHPTFQIEIEGHTDNVPIMTQRYPSNWELSVARATSVLKYFINRHGIDSSRLSIKGNAEQKPLVGNDTPDNRAKNRRVEIRLKEKGVS